MVLKPHSRACYARLAAETGVYEDPWTQVLSAPGGEALFDALLEGLLTLGYNVLEADCGHGLDTQRYAHRVRSYTGYDFIPAFVEGARQSVPQAEFVVWDSSCEPTSEHFKGRFNLVVSRRGPTSIILRLLEVCAPGAYVFCLHPDDGRTEERIGERLAQVGLAAAAQWRVCVQGVLPTLEDFVAYRRFRGDERALAVLDAQWKGAAGEQGFPMEEATSICSVSRRGAIPSIYY